MIKNNKIMFLWIALLILCMIRIFYTLCMDPKMLINIGMNSKIITSIIFSLTMCIIVFVSVLGTYLSFIVISKFSKINDRKLLLKNFKKNLYKIYLESYILYNIIYCVFLLIIKHPLKLIEIKISSILLGILISALIYRYLKHEPISNNIVLEYSLLILLINIVMPLIQLF